MVEEKARYTKEGLPIVTEETLRAYVESALAQSKRENKGLEYVLAGMLLKTILIDNSKLIRTENPELHNYFCEALTYVESIGEEARKGFIAGISLTYELLRRQAEANKLEENL